MRQRLKKVCLTFGWHGFSAERVRVSYHLAGVDSVPTGARERVCLAFG